MKERYEDISIDHLGLEDGDDAVTDQINDALRRVCLKVDRHDHDDKGEVTVKLKVKRRLDDEHDDLLIDAIVTEKMPPRLNRPLKVVCDHDDQRVLVEARQLSLLPGAG